MKNITFDILQLEPSDITPELCELIAGWRNRFRNFYFDNRPTDNERTRRWLQEKFDNGWPFYFYRYAGRLVAHVGLKWHGLSVAELDALVKGDKAPAHTTEDLENAACWEAFKLGAEKVIAQMYDWNWLAIRLHQKVGFKVVEQKDNRITMELKSWMK